MSNKRPNSRQAKRLLLTLVSICLLAAVWSDTTDGTRRLHLNNAPTHFQVASNGASSGGGRGGAASIEGADTSIGVGVSVSDFAGASEAYSGGQQNTERGSHSIFGPGEDRDVSHSGDFMPNGEDGLMILADYAQSGAGGHDNANNNSDHAPGKVPNIVAGVSGFGGLDGFGVPTDGDAGANDRFFVHNVANSGGLGGVGLGGSGGGTAGFFGGGGNGGGNVGASDGTSGAGGGNGDNGGGSGGVSIGAPTGGGTFPDIGVGSTGPLTGDGLGAGSGGVGGICVPNLLDSCGQPLASIKPVPNSKPPTNSQPLPISQPLDDRPIVENIVNGSDSIPQLGGAAAAVPEASTWLMMILGFAFVGSTLRAQRSRARPKLT